MSARYHRQQIVPGFGQAGQARLATGRVLVIGAGGLGCPTLQVLVGAGVGHLLIVDGDRVAETNLHRQLLFTPADIGRPKAEVAAERLSAQNPDVRVEAVTEMLTPANADDLIAAADLVIDGSDTFACRYLVNDRCVRLGKPLVSGSVYQWEGQLSVWNHPVGVGPNLRDLYAEPSDSPACDTGGVIGALPATLGALMALEAIKLLTGLGEALAGRLLVIDGMSLQTRVLSLAPTATNPLRDPSWAPPAQAYDPSCEGTPASTAGTEGIDISAGALSVLLAHGAATLIDVRSADERARANLNPDGLHVPLGTLPQYVDENLDELSELAEAGETLVAYCASGLRSRSAVAVLAQRGIPARHLAGGLEAWRAAGLPLPAAT